MGDADFLKNCGVGLSWLPGEIVETSGPVSFHVLLEDGRLKRCHQDQLRPRVVGDGSPEMSQISVDESIPICLPNPADSPVSVSHETSRAYQGLSLSESPVSAQSAESGQMPDPASSATRTSSSDSVSHRYPCRQRKATEWFEPGLS